MAMTSPTRTAGSRTPTTRARSRWSAAQDALYADARAGWASVGAFRERLTALLAAGAISPPVWRGERQFFMRRTADQEHAQLLTVDPDGTERVLLDPMAMDPSGATTLDSWQPSKEGALLAYQVSEGGREESVLRVLEVDDRRRRRRPDRPRAVLPRRLAARRRRVLLRAAARPRRPARGRGAVPPPGLAAPRRHGPLDRRPGVRRRAAEDELLRRVGQPGRPLAAGVGQRGHRPAQRPVGRRPVGRADRGPGLRRGPDRRRRADRLRGRPRRPDVRVHRP